MEEGFGWMHACGGKEEVCGSDEGRRWMRWMRWMACLGHLSACEREREREGDESQCVFARSLRLWWKMMMMEGVPGACCVTDDDGWG